MFLLVLITPFALLVGLLAMDAVERRMDPSVNSARRVTVVALPAQFTGLEDSCDPHDAAESAAVPA